MPRYKLSVDETVNTLSQVVIDTKLNETELDALLNKIEQTEIPNTFSLISKLRSQGVKVEGVNLGSTSYYSEAKTLEIEELEEQPQRGFMVKCKACDLEEKAIEAAREAMIASISDNGMTAAKTVELSQDLDILIVSYMKKATGHRPK